MYERIFNTDPNTMHVLLTDERIHVQCNVERHYLGVATPAAYKWSRGVTETLEVAPEVAPEVCEAFALAKDRADRPSHMTNLLRMVLSGCNVAVGAQESGLPLEEANLTPDVCAFRAHSTPLPDMHTLVVDCACVQAHLRTSFADVAALRLSSHSLYVLCASLLWES